MNENISTVGNCNSNEWEKYEPAGTRSMSAYRSSLGYIYSLKQQDKHESIFKIHHYERRNLSGMRWYKMCYSKEC